MLWQKLNEHLCSPTNDLGILKIDADLLKNTRKHSQLGVAETLAVHCSRGEDIEWS